MSHLGSYRFRKTQVIPELGLNYNVCGVYYLTPPPGMFPLG